MLTVKFLMYHLPNVCKVHENITEREVYISIKDEKELVQRLVKWHKLNPCFVYVLKEVTNDEDESSEIPF